MHICAGGGACVICRDDIYAVIYIATEGIICVGIMSVIYFVHSMLCKVTVHLHCVTNRTVFYGVISARIGQRAAGKPHC